MEGKIEEIINYLRTLKNLDYSEEEFKKEITISGEYNHLDLSKARGKEVRIESQFTNILDLSYGRFSEVTLKGQFNLVDLTRAKIKTLNIKEAEIVVLDKWRAKICETKN